MSRPKLLYIDATFLTRIGGDMNRSRFLWQTLKDQFDADLLLIRRDDDTDEDIEKHEGDHRVTVVRGNKGKGWLPKSVYTYSAQDLETFRDLLRKEGYEYLFLRATSPGLLALEAEKVLPNAKIVVDSDLVFSQYTKGYWEKDRSLKNRFFLLESKRFRSFEKRLYRRPYLFFVANPEDRKFLERSYWKGAAPSRFEILPNAIAFEDLPKREGKEKNILFFGALDSAPNVDAYQFLMDEVYPHIAKTLESSGVKIFVTGRREQSIYKELIAKHGAENHVRILGGVDDMLATIQESLFTVFPVRQNSGTRVRVLEAAKAKRTAVTTALGAEGYDLGDDCLFIRDTPKDYADAIIQLINDPALGDRMGARLFDSAKGDYGEEVVAANFVKEMVGFQPGRIKLAILANRFYPEVGGAETNIFYQARHLAKNGCCVTVYSPKRIESVSKEYVDGIRVRRLWNLFNPFSVFPYNLPRTFSPSLVFRLLVNRYDVVQSFPSPHYNAMTGLACQKLLGKKTILVSFDFRDYASIIKDTGKITDMLADYRPILRERLALAHHDHVFAISEKEIEFFQSYTDRVSYSPVPILLDEYVKPSPCPRAKYGIDQDAFVFLCLGRVCNVKGQDLALKAFDEALPQLPNAKLVIVGRRDFEVGFNQELTEYVAENGLEKDVIFTDVVEREEVLGWLRHSDIHVIPVRFMNSGAVVVESWASGTPVLQSDVVDPNLVKDGENGFLFRSLSVADLSESMVRAYESRDAFEAMAEKGQALVKERYTYEYLTNLYLEKYRELMG